MKRNVQFKEQDILDELQRRSIEVESRKSIISFMLANSFDITTSQFQSYQEDYTHQFAQYELLKQETERLIKKEYLQNDENLLSWNLDFNAGILTLNYEKV